eukprot:1524903-Rhodomonas_salina.1
MLEGADAACTGTEPLGRHLHQVMLDDGETALAIVTAVPERDKEKRKAAGEEGGRHQITFFDDSLHLVARAHRYMYQQEHIAEDGV